MQFLDAQNMVCNGYEKVNSSENKYMQGISNNFSDDIQDLYKKLENNLFCYEDAMFNGFNDKKEIPEVSEVVGEKVIIDIDNLSLTTRMFFVADYFPSTLEHNIRNAAGLNVLVLRKINAFTKELEKAGFDVNQIIKNVQEYNQEKQIEGCNVAEKILDTKKSKFLAQGIKLRSQIESSQEIDVFEEKIVCHEMISWYDIH